MASDRGNISELMLHSGCKCQPWNQKYFGLIVDFTKKQLQVFAHPALSFLICKMNLTASTLIERTE